MEGARPGRRRLLVALVVVAALVAALIALQSTDERDDRTSSTAFEVKGAAVSRATLSGRVLGAVGARVEITVTVGSTTARAVATPDGRYRIDDLVTGLAEVTWSMEAEGGDGPGSSEGIRIGSSRTGRAQLTLTAGENRFDLDT